MKTNLENLQVVYEDNHIIIINKRTGDIVQADKTGDTPLSEIVKIYIKKKYKKPGNVFLGVVHRLDRPTSGLVIFARTSKALKRLNEMLQKHQIKKTYRAIVKNKPQKNKDNLIHFLIKNSHKNKTTAYDKPTKNAKIAQLSYQIIASSDNYHLLEINLETGRPHQIRAQLAKIHAPIKGDLKYGYPRNNPNGGISLHAFELNFTHPVSKKNIYAVAPYPSEDIWNVFKKQN